MVFLEPQKNHLKATIEPCLVNSPCYIKTTQDSKLKQSTVIDGDFRFSVIPGRFKNW